MRHEQAGFESVVSTLRWAQVDCSAHISSLKCALSFKMVVGGTRWSLLLIIAVQSLAAGRQTFASAEPLQAALAYADAQQDSFNNELLEFVSIPSISALPEHKGDIERAAEWLRGRLGSAGFKVMHFQRCLH